jgi:BirA family transcriptional regulator, biotin operon repressor / biotin---[acetyl-CoA-carboxylase] ligase
MQSESLEWKHALPTLLTTQRFGRTFRMFSECDSTSDEASKLADRGCDDGAVVAADQQAKGRGRLGRVWHSPPGANLYFSLVLRPSLPPAALPPLTLLVGAAVAQTLQDIGIECRLKWPNDIMLPSAGGLKKAGGILTEMASSGGKIKHVIVGVGINVLTTGFPPDLDAIATSLQLASDTPPDRLKVLAAFLNTFEPLYDRFGTEGTAFALAKWRRYGWLGQPCRVERDAGSITGVAVDVDESGALLIEDLGGKRHSVLSGEVVTKL